MKLMSLLFGYAFGMVLLKFNNSLSIMYPSAGYINFLQLFGLLMLVMAIFSWFIWNKFRKINVISLLSGALLLLTTMTAMITGSIYSFDVKTEGFLFYFLATGISVLFFVAEVVRHFSMTKRHALIFSSGLLLGGVAGSFAPSLAVWLMIVAVIVGYCYRNHLVKASQPAQIVE